MPHRYRVASTGDIPLGTGKEVVAGDRVLALFKTESGFHAIDGVCAHAGGPVGKGTLNGVIVTCPWHGWQYDVTTGKHCLNARICQQSFPTSVEGDEVFVEMPDAS